MNMGIQIVNGYPAVYLRDADALCIADLHLGYEGALAENSGITLPSRQLEDVEHRLEGAIAKSETNPSRLIINGDLKHVFSQTSKQEWEEVPLFVSFALELVEEIILVRGNHDTFLGPLRRFDPRRIKIVNRWREKDVLFIHGHNKDFARIIEEESTGVKDIIIAHEHPFLILGDSVGARIKIPCFLRGKIKMSYGNINLMVMPAFSPLAGGTPVNITTKEDFLSPLLNSHDANVDIDDMKVYAVGEEIGVLEFPELKKWKTVSLCL
jgi:hypothetical protein